MNKNSLFSSKSTIRFSVIIIYLIVILAILPISSAIFLAYLIFPIVNFCNTKLKIPYLIAICLVSFFIFSLFALLGFILFQSLVQILPSIQTNITSFSTTYISHPLFPVFIEKLATILDTVVMFSASLAKNILNSIFELLIFIIAFYFALYESKKNRLWFFAFTPKSLRSVWQHYFTKSMQLLSYFINVGFQLFTLTFILLSCGLTALQFDAPISKAFLISLADALPFLGIGLFLIPAAVYFFFTDQLLLCVALLVLYIFIQVTRQLAESKLWAHTFQLRMVHTFFISAASILLFGIYGILLSPIFLVIAVKVKQSSIFER
ncbi:AI-2E family transporter [Solibacillus sp. FSL H8-0538]|uniref:AI-2E family transporter n=1 Tax=Solibacillus sp. FSL H8-0538 TaxID=2921400 RepID=UPI0030FCB2BA